MNHDQYDEDAEPTENIARGLFAVASAIRYAAAELGNGNAGTPMGALEAHGVAMKEAADAIAEAILEHAEKK